MQEALDLSCDITDDDDEEVALRDVPVVAGFLCDEAALLSDIKKGTPCICPWQR